MQWLRGKMGATKKNPYKDFIDKVKIYIKDKTTLERIELILCYKQEAEKAWEKCHIEKYQKMHESGEVVKSSLDFNGKELLIKTEYEQLQKKREARYECNNIGLLNAYLCYVGFNVCSFL